VSPPPSCPSRLTLALLTSSVPAAVKRGIREQIASGEIDIVVGTQAVIQESVSFHRLGLAVVDEQHRFGVMQRAALREKGRNPHVLVMTATPIPRTLTLTVYGDLDVSVIDELPPGASPSRRAACRRRAATRPTSSFAPKFSRESRPSSSAR